MSKKPIKAATQRPCANWTDYEAFAEACQAAGGVVRSIAKQLNCHHGTVYRQIEKDEKLAEILEDARKEFCGECKDLLVRKVREDGDVKVAQWWLSRRDPMFKLQSESESPVAVAPVIVQLPDNGRNNA